MGSGRAVILQCFLSFPSGMEGNPCWSVTPYCRNPREGVGLALGECALSVLRFDVSVFAGAISL